MERRIEISKQTDHEGFSSFECNLCKEEFKLVPGDVEEDHVLEVFCPSCGIPQSPSELLTEDILEHAQTVLEQEAFNIINDAFKDLGKSFKGNKGIKFKAGKPLKAKVPQTLFEQKDYNIVEFMCCSKSAKLSTFSMSGIGPYCPYCGVN
ncbi:hypothetical protein [Priestia endophytica]|uniref:hypothetical protein n=1 Tax=Priestia endophytica TaxID=135735 RepID=UPI0022827983|nr:hypothetical protein [Priestia endophytica]MCY8234916.1 hypothetical protein [Priestia endophytica]